MMLQLTTTLALFLIIAACINAYTQDHGDPHSTTEGYDLEVTRQGGGAFIASQEITLELKPTHLDSFVNTSTLHLIHDRFIHVILLAHDYSHIVHTHPEDWTTDIHASNAEEKYLINTTFPLGGKWIVGIDFLHEVDGNKTVIDVYTTIEVTGPAQSTPVIDNFDTSRHFKTYELVGEDQYVEHVSFADNLLPGGHKVDVKVNGGEMVHAENCVSVAFSFYKPDGSELANILPYLDAPMHAIFVHEDRDKSYFYHVHGTQDNSTHDSHNDTTGHHKRDHGDTHSDDACAHNHAIGGFDETKHLGSKLLINFNFPFSGNWMLITQIKFDDDTQHESMIFTQFGVQVHAAATTTESPTEHSHTMPSAPVDTVPSTGFVAKAAGLFIALIFVLLC